MTSHNLHDPLRRQNYDERDEQVDTDDHNNDEDESEYNSQSSQEAPRWLLQRPEPLLTRSNSRVHFHDGILHPHLMQVLDTLDDVEQQPIDSGASSGWTNVGDPPYQRTPDSPLLFRQIYERQQNVRDTLYGVDVQLENWPVMDEPFNLSVHNKSSVVGYVVSFEDMPGR